MERDDVELLRTSGLAYIMRFIGKWYKWAGDDPSGFDCSGLSVEFLKSAGIIDRQSDYTAHMLFGYFQDCQVKAPYAGCLSLHLNNQGHATHVEICINRFQTVGASGGNSKTLTAEDAIRDNAFIKVRPIRGNMFVDPFKKLEKSS